MFTGHGDHHSAAPSVLCDKGSDHGEHIHKGHGSCGRLCGVVDCGSLGGEIADVDTASAPIAVCASKILAAVKDGFDGIFYAKDVAIGIGDFLFVCDASVGKYPSAKEKLLFDDEALDDFVSA